MGGRPPVAPLPPQFEVLSTAASSQATTPVPLAQPDLSLGSSSSVILVLEDSSITPTKVKGTTALVIEDKPSDLSLKDITHVNFDATMTRSYLVAPFVPSFTKINPPLPPALLDVSHPMA
jgi:hypothetical protein